MFLSAQLHPYRPTEPRSNLLILHLNFAIAVLIEPLCRVFMSSPNIHMTPLSSMKCSASESRGQSIVLSILPGHIYSLNRIFKVGVSIGIPPALPFEQLTH